MERNNEIIRQWKILRQISTAADWTIARLAREHTCCRRTISRDLEALDLAGFPLYDVTEGPEKHWRLDSEPIRGLKDTGFTFAELCALYVNGSGTAARHGSPMDADLDTAMAKLTSGLSSKMKRYLDEVAGAVTTRAVPGRRRGEVTQKEYKEALIRATLERRAIEMTYHSFSSRRVKQYVVEPHRISCEPRGLYFFAYVPEYSQMRTFAVQRVKKLRLLERHFDPVALSRDPYADSFGVFTGKAEPVSLHFSAQAAPYVEEGEWHPSQSISRLPDGTIVLKMKVNVDLSLRSWILGFGHLVRVLKPASLAEDILQELEEARERYAAGTSLALPATIFDDRQIRLPFHSDHGDARRKPAAAPRARSRRASQSAA